jgi:predicted dehydrogenase
VKFEDTASLMLKLKGGGSAQITTNWITPFKAREIQVIAKDKFVRGNLLTQHVQEFGRFSADDQSYVVRDVYVRQEEPLKKELVAFIDAIQQDMSPPITGMDGYEALRAAVHASSSHNNLVYS